MKNETHIKTSVVLIKEEWDIFKEITRGNNSDASKEIRKFIKEYIKQNQSTYTHKGGGR